MNQSWMNSCSTFASIREQAYRVQGGTRCPQRAAKTMRLYRQIFAAIGPVVFGEADPPMQACVTFVVRMNSRDGFFRLLYAGRLP